jgi:hypothetical protein
MPRIPLTRPTVPSLPSRKRRRPPSQPHASSLPVATAQLESAQPSGTLHTALDPSQSTDSISCPPAPPSRIPDTLPTTHVRSAPGNQPTRKRQATLHSWLSQSPNTEAPAQLEPPARRSPAHGRATEGPPT